MSNSNASMHSGEDSASAWPLPSHRNLYYGGAWHAPVAGGYLETINPASGASLGPCAEADAADIDLVVAAAAEAFPEWRKVKPTERAAMMRQIAKVLRENAEELAFLDSLNGGNPISEMSRDVETAAKTLDFFAGLVTELKGTTIPMGEGIVNMAVREPFGVVARIVAYNHPLMFLASRAAPALIAGNTVVLKPPYQAPLSAYRMMELIEGIVPPGVINIATCGREGSNALAAHPDVLRVSLTGSVETGRAVARAGADRLKRVTLELGGKNAFVIYPDADLDKAAKAAVEGMNFTWCGQSCGSTSRLFIHDSVYDQVVEGVLQGIRHYVPGIPTDPKTTMGAIISQAQLDKVMFYIEDTLGSGAQLLYGGRRPNNPDLANGFFIEPTVFAGVTQDMRIAKEEVFGPVLSIFKWHDEEQMLRDVNAVDYGLTGAVWTKDLGTAHRVASRIESGYVWVNSVGSHFIGASYGGYKQSGIGREESIEELVSFTQEKNIHIVFE